MLRDAPAPAAPLLVGVGAAFDFHAGLVPQAPAWMQRNGLEWAYRLSREPRRLWRRYARYNPLFVAGFAAPVRARSRAAARLIATLPGHAQGDRRRACAANLLRWMTSSQSTADVAVVGLGRVGLPLALWFADRGLSVIGVDNDPARLDAVREGRMPFAETGAQELLERVHARRAR